MSHQWTDSVSKILLLHSLLTSYQPRLVWNRVNIPTMLVANLWKKNTFFSKKPFFAQILQILEFSIGTPTFLFKNPAKVTNQQTECH